ncbi:Small conductance calcium-activated potassium channel protein [Operophtera brumata]|uniref:Small conductance calcium-activated potassium channel protein n=1 Tax=Operophtera brumata TaxID=104452 RepID=A0A0L7KY49_OPEBR|nr:Small conductance calcium-activated potassium channel protein [Operophtera brumata]
MSAPAADSTEAITNSGYGSSDETASLLVTGPSVTVIVPTTENRAVKPILQRQDCTTHLRPQLSGGPGSEESAASIRVEDAATRSVPDIELQCRDQLDRPQTLVSPVATCSHRGSVTTCQLVPHSYSRCRVCERRQSTAPVSALQLARSVSRESVRSALHYPCGCSSFHAVSTCPVIQPPALLLPTTSNRIIRQSSQPESSACAAHCPHAHQHPSASLRQLREPGDGIAGIAADSLRINGGMRPFKQGLLLCPQTLSQTRRARLRRAFTEATGDTVTYVKTVGNYWIMHSHNHY